MQTIRDMPLAFFPCASRLKVDDCRSGETMEKNYFPVLLVEDDLNDIFLVKRAFKIAQIENPLQIVTDGQEAINYLRGDGKYADRGTHPLPKLIVMDINMPKRNGFEVLEWVKG